MNLALHKPAFCCVLGAIGALAADGARGAVEWRNVPAVTVGAGSDSNIRMRPMDPERAANTSLTAAADVVARDVGFQFHVHPQVRALRYADDAEADRNDAFATFDLGIDNSRQRWTLGGNYSRESTLTSEFGDAGFFGVDVERAQRSLNAGLGRVMGPRGNVNFAASTTDVEYRDALESPFNDYRYGVLQASYQRSAGTRSGWAVSASTSLLDREVGTANSASTTVQATWSRVFSAALSGEVGVRVLAVDSLGPDADPSASFNFALARTGPRWTLRSTGGRDVRPEGRGVLAIEDAVTFDVERRFGARLRVNAALRGSRVVAAGFLADAYDRRYSQASVGVNWRVTERVEFVGELYQRAQASTLTPHAVDLGSALSITYRGR